MMFFVVNMAQNIKAKSYANELPDMSLFVTVIKVLICYRFHEHDSFEWTTRGHQDEGCLTDLVKCGLVT
jgi:hypothetical protein